MTMTRNDRKISMVRMIKPIRTMHDARPRHGIVTLSNREFDLLVEDQLYRARGLLILAEELAQPMAQAPLKTQLGVD